MKKATPKMRDFAQRLIACETRVSKTTKTGPQPALLACEKLRSHLEAMLGSAGVLALLTRSLALAKAEVPYLSAVHFASDGRLELSELQAQMGAEEFADGGVILLAHLLGLLVAFIGEKLTLRMVQDAWPKLSLYDSNYGNGDKT